MVVLRYGSPRMPITGPGHGNMVKCSNIGDLT